MKVLLAPASFKGSYQAYQAAQFMASALTQIQPGWELVLCPMVDGGEGTREAWSLWHKAETRTFQVPDWTGQVREVPFAWRESREGSESGKIQTAAWIESADVLGWHLSPERKPMRATSFGLGVLLKHVLRLRPDQLYFGLGGTVSVDAGLGLLAGLGGGFWAQERAITCPAEWSHEARLKPCEFDSKETQCIAVCDVNNALLGPEGARVYMAQKGVAKQAEGQLEAIYQDMVQEMDPQQNRATRAGAGAAGGLGFALACLGFQLIPGSSFWAQITDLKTLIQECDLVISGEGQLDRQSWLGKPIGLLNGLCQELDKPLYALCGQIQGVVPPGIRAVQMGGTAPYTDFLERVRSQFAAWFGAL